MTKQDEIPYPRTEDETGYEISESEAREILRTRMQMTIYRDLLYRIVIKKDYDAIAAAIEMLKKGPQEPTP